MRMIAWLRALFVRQRAPIPPVLVRARAGGKTPREVVVDAVWYPSGARRAYRAKDAQGLCMLPWMADAERVSMRVRAPIPNGTQAEADLEVHADDARDGQAFDLTLH
jgi:hypothetical protein